jgi:hypothetical protein
MDVIEMPPLVITAGKFPNVFVFPRKRIVDPGNNVLLAANLFNFAINSDRPLLDHDRWLAKVATPLLTERPAAGARIVGLASRSGAADHNLRLSRRRAQSIDTSLSLLLFASDLVNPPSPPPRTSVGGQGEHFAASVGAKDGTEESRFRSVLVTLLVDRTKNTPVKLLPA